MALRRNFKHTDHNLFSFDITFSYEQILQDPNFVQTPDFCLTAVKSDGRLLRFIKNPTLEICEAAIGNDPAALEFVPEAFQSEALCLKIVEKRGHYLKYCKVQTPAICLAAVKDEGHVLEYVKQLTLEVCEAACEDDGNAIVWVPVGLQTETMCRNALDADVKNFQYIANQTHDLCIEAINEGWTDYDVIKIPWTEAMCLAAVEYDGLFLEDSKFKTDQIIWTAVSSNGFAIQFVEDQTPDLCQIAIERSPMALQFIKNQTEELCLRAVSINGMALQHVQVQTPAICLKAVQNDGNALKFVHKQTAEIIEAAINNDEDATKYIHYTSFLAIVNDSNTDQVIDKRESKLNDINTKQAESKIPDQVINVIVNSNMSVNEKASLIRALIS